ncbi:importin subunit alpha-5-like [Macrosteles quadrilineatus]|uniref:importin subunit alpha-5-like n=1 Tax=Macrosteles quadrilineatus TaxID=74068 RepID=UPI0023E18E30|nr:importin subunit alpha-5-like [Macrosteles quadrilineatus]
MIELPEEMEMSDIGGVKSPREAAWALIDATTSGPAERIHDLIKKGYIGPMCDFLLSLDYNVVQQAINAVEIILKLGAQDAIDNAYPVNQYAVLIEERRGLDKLKFLEAHNVDEISMKAYDIIENFFNKDYEDARPPSSQ